LIQTYITLLEININYNKLNQIREDFHFSLGVHSSLLLCHFFLQSISFCSFLQYSKQFNFNRVVSNPLRRKFKISFFDASWVSFWPVCTIGWFFRIV
jgi:hypothetical protein